jgi:hypothetical protein
MSRKCPHAKIQYCPLYVGMHIVDGPSCISTKLDEGLCAVDLGASYEDLVAAFFRAHPAMFSEITLAERAYESGEQRNRNMRAAGIH